MKQQEFEQAQEKFGNTAEYKLMKYKEAMKCDDKKFWDEAVEEEYKKFLKYKVFKPVKKSDVPKNAKFNIFSRLSFSISLIYHSI